MELTHELLDLNFDFPVVTVWLMIRVTTPPPASLTFVVCPTTFLVDLAVTRQTSTKGCLRTISSPNSAKVAVGTRSVGIASAWASGRGEAMARSAVERKKSNSIIVCIDYVPNQWEYRISVTSIKLDALYIYV